jgi:hypothetical protein
LVKHVGGDGDVLRFEVGVEGRVGAHAEEVHVFVQRAYAGDIEA